MRNLLSKALNHQLQAEINKAPSQEALHELYAKFEEKAEDCKQGIAAFAELLFKCGLEAEDAPEGARAIPSDLVLNASLLLKNTLTMLDLSLNAKDQISDQLYRLATQGQGGK